jgi:hypothetical protein
VVFDLTNATVNGTVSGGHMTLTGPIPKGQFMDYHPDTVTATDDVMAIDIDIDRAAADTGGIVGLNVHTTTGDMANAEASYGIKLGFDQSACTTATSLLYGISVENITGDAQVTETAIAIGTGWDVGIDGGSNSIVTTGYIRGAMEVQPADADGATITTATMNSIHISSGVGDWEIPDVCDSATGQWVTLTTNAAHVASFSLNDANDQIVTTNGTKNTADHELDTAGGAYDSCTVVCVEANVWMVVGEIGTCVTGGAS